MLHILLMLLKIIGIILLVILGILVLSVCLALFVPLRYRGEAQVDDGIESIKAYLKFSWFLHLVSGYVTYENKKLDWQVRVFWKKVNVGEESAKFEKAADNLIDKADKPEQMTSDEEDGVSAETKALSQRGQKTKKQTFFEKIKYTIRNICDKIKLLVEKKEKMQEFVSNEIHRASWNRVVQEIVRLLRHIRPRKLILNLQFGFEDSALTGKVLGGLSMLYPFYAKHINITPNFEEKELKGDVFIKGNVRGIRALIIIWNLIFDKNIRTTYKEIQKWKG